MGGALALDPRRAICWRTLVISVPAILHPLVNAATHVMQSKRIWRKTANLDRLLGGCDVGAILAIGHAGLELVTPPILGLRAATRPILPFGFRRQSIGLSSHLSEPGDVLLRVGPADVRDGCVLFSAGYEAACFCRSAFIPFPNRNREFADSKGLYR